MNYSTAIYWRDKSSTKTSKTKNVQKKKYFF